MAPSVGPLIGACFEITGESYVNVDIDVPMREFTTILLNVTIPDPVGWRHVTVDVVVHDTVPHEVDPNVNDGVRSENANSLP
jgi:hypothetical protein